MWADFASGMGGWRTPFFVHEGPRRTTKNTFFVREGARRGRENRAIASKFGRHNSPRRAPTRGAPTDSGSLRWVCTDLMQLPWEEVSPHTRGRPVGIQGPQGFVPDRDALPWGGGSPAYAGKTPNGCRRRWRGAGGGRRRGGRARGGGWACWRGRGLDNVFCERRWRSVECDNIYLQQYDSVRQLQAGLRDDFDLYNHGRPRQSLNYRTPAEEQFVL